MHGDHVDGAVAERRRLNRRHHEALVVAEAPREPAVLGPFQRMPREQRVTVQHAEALSLAVRRVEMERHLCAARDPFEVVDVLAEGARAIDLLERDHLRLGPAHERRRPRATRAVRHVERHHPERITTGHLHPTSVRSRDECSRSAA